VEWPFGYGFQLPADVTEVIDLTVEDDHKPPIGRKHGLMTLRREVEYGKTSVSEGDARPLIHPDASVIRAPMV
jgi:hypothetical protein